MTLTAAPVSARADDPAPLPPEVDASFRSLSLHFAWKSGFWLLVGAFLSLLASVKLHAPGMMSESAWLTYGRLLPAGWSAVVYGFAGQIGMALGLWLVARAARRPLQGGLLVFFGCVLWNIGVLVGVVAILLGHSTGREWLEMPAGAMGFLVVGAGLIGACGWVTHAGRQESRTYPSSWFVLLALIAFVWFGTVALAMLAGGESQGVVQVLVQRWFANGAAKLWLGSLAVGCILFLLPSLAGRPLASRQLALYTFWCLVLFAPWAVAHHGDPFPRWVVSAGVGGRTLAVIGLAALALNLWKTAEGTCGRWCTSTRGLLICSAAGAYILGGALEYVASLRPVASVVRLTWTTQGLDWLWVGGAASLAFLALLPDFVARTSGRTLNPALVRWHAILTLAGIGLIALPLILAGVIQGLSMARAASTYMDVLRGSLHAVRLSSLGFTLLALAQFLLVGALFGVARQLLNDGLATLRQWSAVPVNGKRAEARS